MNEPGLVAALASSGNNSHCTQKDRFTVAGLNKLDYNGAIFKQHDVKERI